MPGIGNARHLTQNNFYHQQKNRSIAQTRAFSYIWDRTLSQADDRPVAMQLSSDGTSISFFIIKNDLWVD